MASDIVGVSGRAMIEALVGGERGGRVLADLVAGAMRKKIAARHDALVGRFDDHHAARNEWLVARPMRLAV
ncbi:hypothetical protein [Catellatospora tritici]|uniref:hypothetical protein n=1 Tax=Catellatospora tritici TaxID=2851566 RepID=UPI001C2D7CE8|nr:hypothetical protein [Catellatospora tritici]MBV1856365.1 hypothetical protein [Catellatospora tritici]